MNDKRIKWLKVIGLSVCFGIGVTQLFFALCWAWKNGSNVQDFYDTGIYFRDALNMTCDGWRLTGYSCVLRVFMWFESILGDYYIVMLYLFQAIISLLCFTEGCRSIGKYLFDCSLSFYKLMLPAVYIITLPVIWQMQFAVLPDALCLSLTILVLAKILECVSRPDKINIYSYFIIGGSVLVIGLMEHHYFYGVICLLAFHFVILCFRWFKSKFVMKKSLWQAAIILLLMLCTTFVTDKVNDSVPKTDNYISYSLEAELISRFVYPNLQADYSFYDESIKAVLPQENAQAAVLYIETYYNEIGVLMENNYAGNVADLFLYMAKKGASLHAKEIVSGTTKEILLYTFIPFAMVKNMYSNGNSLYGHNYTKMYEISPKLTADYMHVGMNGFLCVVMVGIISGLIQIAVNRKILPKRVSVILYGLLNVLSVIVPMMLLSMMKFDYRIGLFSVYMWGIYSVGYLYMIFANKKSKIHTCDVGYEEKSLIK